MKANELMIGDWVFLWGNVPHKIDSLNEDNQVRLDVSTGYFSCDVIEPIPITPEILEKNGFETNKHVCPYPYYEYINKEDHLKVDFAFPQGNKTSYKDPWVYIDSERVFIEHLPCVFVHQLQQILRFCRIEKEIVL